STEWTGINRPFFCEIFNTFRPPFCGRRRRARYLLTFSAKKRTMLRGIIRTAESAHEKISRGKIFLRFCVLCGGRRVPGSVYLPSARRRFLQRADGKPRFARHEPLCGELCPGGALRLFDTRLPCGHFRFRDLVES